MFNFFKKKHEKGVVFNIFDESTWDQASDSIFALNDKTILSPAGDGTSYFTEKKLVEAISGSLRGISSFEDAREKIKIIGRKNIINHMLNYLIPGMNWGDVMSEAVHWINNYNQNEAKLNFDVSNMSTWKFASEQYIIWNNKLIYDKDQMPITQKAAVDLFNAIYAFLERDGEKLTSDYKIEKAKGLLNKLANPIESNNENQTNEPRNEKFDPRDPETYQFATNNQLILDSVEIYDEVNETYYGNGEYKKPVSEKEFVQLLSMLLSSHKKAIVWEEAISLVKPDFMQGGKEPTNETPGYIEKVNEVCEAILKNPNTRLTKKQEKEYIEHHIKSKIQQCFPESERIKTYGGYSFTEAQLSVIEGLPEEYLDKIGKILKDGVHEHSGKLKQNIFNATGYDGYHVVALRHAKGKDEENIMHDYFLGYEDFETEQSVHDFFNSIPYLEKHPRLKKEVIKSVIKLQIEGSEK
jgi:hypothetical protein